jgi:hypothetical protein
MKPRLVCVAVAAFMATSSCLAANAPAPPNSSPPVSSAPQPLYKSIWQVDDKGAIIHLQSGLSCDPENNTFRRTDVRAYKPTGLDVSCNYIDAWKTLITLYLTRREHNSLADDFAEAEREMLRVSPDASPLPSSGETGGLRSALYRRSGGSIKEGIFIGDISGWTLEYRATWTNDEDATVFAEVAALTTRARESAGGHLERCAKSSVPARDGVAVASDKSAMNVAFTASAMVEALPDSGKFTPDPAIRPVEWCVETSITDADQTMLLWHGLNEMGTTVEADRATLMTTENPLVLESYADPEFNKIETELKRTDTPIYTVTRANGDDVDVVDYFSRRPDGVTLAHLASDLLSHKVHVTARYNAKTKSIIFATPESH